MIKKDFCESVKNLISKLISKKVLEGEIHFINNLNNEKAKIYILLKLPCNQVEQCEKYLILEFETKDTKTNPLMGWESSTDTLNSIVLKFSSKEKQ